MKHDPFTKSFSLKDVGKSTGKQPMEQLILKDVSEAIESSSLTLSQTISALPVLEPLCKATGSLLKPVHIYPHDYLMVEIDKAGTRFVVHAESTKTYKYGGEMDQHRAPASWNAQNVWLRKIPEKFQPARSPESKARMNTDKKWILGGTDITVLIMAHQWKGDQIRFATPEAKILYEFLLARFLMQTHSSLIGAEFKVNKTIPEDPRDFIDHPDPELRLLPYQKVALAMCEGKEAFALFMQQGTGKTPVSIARLCLESRRHYNRSNRMLRALIVCPRGVRKNWQNEISRFTTTPGKIAVLRGDKLRRIRGITDAVREDKDCRYGVAICSYESIENTWEAIGKIPWDLVILDESHYIKSPNSQRSKVCRDKLRENVKMRMILTGTPITNHVMDLWSQFEFLAEGMSGFMTFKNFRKFYGKYAKVEGVAGVEKLVGMKNLPLIQERLTRISFSITKKEANLNLPEKTFDVYEVEMTKKQKEFYVKIQKELALEIEQDENTNKLVTADHILTKLLILGRITSGHIKWNNQYDFDGEILVKGKVEQIDTINPKIEAVVEMLRQTKADDPKCKTLIWACWVEDIEALSRRLKEEKIGFLSFYGATKDKDRDVAEDKFNKDPSIEVWLGNPASCGEGLNLLGYNWEDDKEDQVDTYCGHEIFFSQNWSPTQRSQAEDRAHRKGTRSNVRITDLQVPFTIDEEIRERVLLKRKTALAIQDIKSLLFRVLKNYEFAA